MADLNRALRGPSSTVLAALDDGVLAGTAMVGHDGHRGWVYCLAVTADRRGDGVGRALMSACEAWLCAAGVGKVQVVVRESNAAVTGFYARLGYVDQDVRVFGRWL